MSEDQWWVFVAVGILLIAAEVFIPGYIIMWFGIAAIITAGSVYLGASTNAVILTFILSSLLLTTYVRQITLSWLHGSRTTRTDTNAVSLIGKKGYVTEEIAVVGRRGKVVVGRETWSAVLESDLPLAEGEIVRVIGIDGVKLIVEKEVENA